MKGIVIVFCIFFCSCLPASKSWLPATQEAFQLEETELSNRSRVRRYQQPFDLVIKAAKEGVLNSDFKIIDEGPTFIIGEKCCFNMWEWNEIVGVYLRPVDEGTEVVIQTRYAPDLFTFFSLGIPQEDAAKQYRLQIFGATENSIGLLRK